MSRVVVALIAALVSFPIAFDSLQAQVVPAGFADSLIAGGLSQPVGITFLPDGRLLFVQQNNFQVRMVDAGVVTTLGVVSSVQAGGERGLLGVAVDPRWPASPYLYFHLTATGTPPTVRIVRYTVTGDLTGTGSRLLTLDTATRYELISDAPNDRTNHNGGTVRFGIDNMLYVSLGEDATACAAQDTLTLRGVLLRLDVTRLPAGAGSATRDLITPADNPFLSHPNLNARLVWAFGLRNPFRFQVDRTNGEIFISDVGEVTFEEVDLANQPGMNFGWPLREGPGPRTTCGALPTSGYADPIFSYDRTAAGSGSATVITAGAYRAPALATAGFGASYEGDVFLSDYYSGNFWRLKRSGNTWALAAPDSGQPDDEHWAILPTTVSDYAIAPDGSLWYCRQSISFSNNTGEIRRIGRSDVQPPPQQIITAVRPSPSSGNVRVDLTLPRTSRVAVDVFDARGRRVRLVQSARVTPAGPTALAWDGLDDAREPAPSGLYFIRIEIDGTVHARRAVLVR